MRFILSVVVALGLTAVGLAQPEPSLRALPDGRVQILVPEGKDIEVIYLDSQGQEKGQPQPLIHNGQMPCRVMPFPLFSPLNLVYFVHRNPPFSA